MTERPESLAFLARLVPVTHVFSFNSAEEFETKAGEIVLEWAPKLAGKTFYVRISRRGFKGRLSSPEKERFLDTILHDGVVKSLCLTQRHEDTKRKCN